MTDLDMHTHCMRRYSALTVHIVQPFRSRVVWRLLSRRRYRNLGGIGRVRLRDMCSPSPNVKSRAFGDDFETAWQQVHCQLQGGGFDVRRLLPRPRATGNRDEDAKHMRHYVAQVKLIALMVYNPSKVLDWVADAEKSVLQPSGSNNDDERFVAGTYLFVKVEVPWRMAFLSRYYASNGLTFETLKRVVQKDKNGIIDVVDFLAGFTPSTKLPAECILKKTCDHGRSCRTGWGAEVGCAWVLQLREDSERENLRQQCRRGQG